MKKLSLEDLVQFTGTDNLYRTTFSKSIVYTDGVKYVAETAGAYWLIDTIVISQCIPEVKAEEFQVWLLRVRDNSGVLTCGDGNGHEVYREVIDYTDFPLSEISMWLTDGILLLPSEY